jgi:uncharacterized membrane protein YebE (DUF533 family)
MPLDKLLGSIQNNPAITGALSGAAGGALVSAFTNKKSAKKLLQAGGLVAVGGLAYKAYQSYRHNQNQTQADPAISQISEQQFNDVALGHRQPEATAAVLLSMIAAAHADGHLSEIEQQKIWQQALDLGLPSTALAHLNNQLSQPPSITELVAAAPNMETKIEVYTAAALVTDDSCEAGRAFLLSLANALALPAHLVDALNEQTARSQAAA